MRMEQFTRVLGWIGAMSEKQLDELLVAVDQRRAEAKALRVVEDVAGLHACPSCGDAEPYRNGRSRGLQRYRCRSCSRTFNATSGTPLAGLHSKERFYKVGQCLADGLTVRESAEVLGVATSTAFRLRHRFLDAAVAHQPGKIAGLLECDETYFRESKKGCRSLGRPARKRGGKPKGKGKGALIPVLVGRVRGQPHTVDAALTMMTVAEARDALAPVVGPDTLLCIDGSGALRSAAKDLGVATKSIAVHYDGRVSEGVYHVQTVNSYHERLKTWLNRRLRGVSTRHLPKYLAWMRTQEWFKNEAKPEHFVLAGLGKRQINT